MSCIISGRHGMQLSAHFFWILVDPAHIAENLPPNLPQNKTGLKCLTVFMGFTTRILDLTFIQYLEHGKLKTIGAGK